MYFSFSGINYSFMSRLTRAKKEKNLSDIIALIDVLSTDSKVETKNVLSRPLASLYKRDPTRYKPRHKIFTQQSEIGTNTNSFLHYPVLTLVRLVDNSTTVSFHIKN